MKVLVVPMSAMAETAGSFLRATLLVKALKDANIETVSYCNFQELLPKSVLYINHGGQKYLIMNLQVAK